MANHPNRSKTKVNEHTITDEQIRALRAEAMQAGDGEQVDICDLALQSRRNGTAAAGQRKYLRICARVIDDAAAQE